MVSLSDLTITHKEEFEPYTITALMIVQKAEDVLKKDDPYINTFRILSITVTAENFKQDFPTMAEARAFVMMMGGRSQDEKGSGNSSVDMEGIQGQG